MSFDPYAATQTTLAQMAQSTKDPTVQQDKSLHADRIGQTGLAVAEFDVEMFADDAGSLAAGTYYLKARLPAGAIISGNVISDHHEPKVGSGTITPAVGATSLTALTTKAVRNEVSNLAIGTKVVAETRISVVVASAAVTAGAFTLYIPYVISGVLDS